MPSPTLRDLEDASDFLMFVAIVEQGGIAGASRALGVPKSRLSRRLADLENRFAVQLAHRNSRLFVVTELGQAFYERCKQTLDSAQAARDFVAQAQARPKGELRVSAPAPLANLWLAPILPTFLERHPELSVELDARNLFVDLVEDRIDLAIRIRPTPLDDSDLIVRHIGVSRSILVAAPDFPNVAELRTPEDLAQRPLLTVPAAAGPQQWRLRRRDGAESIVAVASRLSTFELAVLRQAAEAGAGVALLPAHYCNEQIECGRLVRVLADWAGPTNDIHVAYLSRKGLSAGARAFLDFLIEELPPGDRK